MDYSYLLAPFITWFIAGSLKFMVNRIRFGSKAIQLVGYGGLPSNHSAIVTCMTTLIAMKEGIQHPAFGAALTIAFIVILDASSLRMHVGNQSKEINKINVLKEGYKPLRERIGHSKIEIMAGIVVGVIVGIIISQQ